MTQAKNRQGVTAFSTGEARRFATSSSVALALFCLISPLPAKAEGGASGGAGSLVDIAGREATRRDQQIRNAQELLTSAELERREGNYAVAVKQFRTAFQSTPKVPASMTLRDSIFTRYQQGAVDYARQLIDEAKWEEAEAVLTQVMADGRDAGYPPGKIRSEVRTLLAQIKSDDHFNKALSPEHLANVRNVVESLKLAQGFVEIGDFDKAKKAYHQVLNIDRYNSAARRGLEMVDQMVMEYSEVARDQTRASQLRQVAEAWETPIPRLATGTGFSAGVVSVTDSRKADIEGKLNRLILPNVEFSNTPLEGVIEYLTQISQEIDTGEPDPTKRGINIVLDTRSTTNAAEIRQRPITLKLSNAPLSAVLTYAAQQALMKYRVDDFAVSIVPLSASDDNQLITRSYSVPPNFISGQGAQGGGAGGGAVDPFAAPDPAAGGGNLVKRVTAREFLENNGVTFPEGSLARFNPANSSLVVKNTAANISLIEDMILSSREGGTKLVSVEFKLLETTDEILNELGFDWMLGQFNVPGSQEVFAGGGTAGNAIGSRTAADFPFIDPGGTVVGQSPVTSGLRSGNINSRLSIDDVINRDSPTQVGSGAAPGILSVAGAFTDPQFQMVLRALSQKKGTDLLCSATVVTRPGERAVIKQIREFIYPTEYDPPEIPNEIGNFTTIFFDASGQTAPYTPGSVAVTPSNPAAFETRELGKILEVEPTVGSDNFTIDLNLTVDLSEFSGFINYGSPITASDNLFQGVGYNAGGFLTVFTTALNYEVTENRILMPVFDSTRETTSASIYDGQTLVIGGLVGETVTKGEDKVPLMGDAPFIGQFFRSEIEQRFRRAMLLFATVRILDPAGKPINEPDAFQNTASLAP